jgi:hypothetical protein
VSNPYFWFMAFVLSGSGQTVVGCKGLDLYWNGNVYRAIATGDLIRDVIVVKYVYRRVQLKF